MKFAKNKKVIAVMVMSLALAGVAWASWTADGDGSGTATAGESNDVTVSGTVADAIYPTGEFDMSVTVTNTNPFKVHVSDVQQTAGEDVSTLTAGCSADELTFDTQDNGAAGWTLDAAGGANDSVTFTATDALNVTNDIEDECQLAEFDVPLTAHAQSSE